MSTGYEEDFFTWTQEQAAYLKQGRFDLLDLEHLAEEVGDMGKSEQRELAQRLAVLIAHLLKLQVQLDRTRTNEKSWRNTVRTQRRSLSRHLQQNPGLKNPMQMTRALENGWDDGRDQAIQETGIDPDLFPEDNPYSLEQLLDPDFWP
jgi:NTP pyrophosphatase (non-canonical NTP hydrolase)